MSQLLDNDNVYQFVTETTYEVLPESVKLHAKRCLKDLVSTLASGSLTPTSRIINDFAKLSFGSVPGAVMAPSMAHGDRLSISGAALVDATTIDAIDAHDGHALTKGHVGCSIIGALAAIVSGGERNYTGKEILTKLVIGYELGTRFGIALHRTTADYHSSGAWNALTCAALVSDHLDLNNEQFEHALGIAEYNGPRSQLMRDVDHPTMVKDGSGWGAMVGVSAAYMARLGFTGAPALIFKDTCVADTWEDLGNNWYILEQYFKPYPVCRWAHPAIDAVLMLKKMHGITIQDVKRVVVRTFHEASRLSKVKPETSDQAQYATCFPIAVALSKSRVLPQDVADENLKDPVVLDIFDKIEIVEELEFSKRFPAERLAAVDIYLVDGSLHSSEPFISRGDPKNPLSESEIEEKFFSMCVPVWGEEKSCRVIGFINAIDMDDNVDAAELFALIRA
ncbi:MmgE/PrpD family protein [Salinicola corii]|nr:MmgE/PrpD family protein [Salinicola corii]